MIRQALIAASLLASFAAVADVMPMYAAMPSQVALLHRQGDVSAYAHGGINGFATGGSVALSDHLGVRLSGGYRPWATARPGSRRCASPA